MCIIICKFIINNGSKYKTKGSLFKIIVHWRMSDFLVPKRKNNGHDYDIFLLQITKLSHGSSRLFISIFDMFRAAMCPSSGELLYQCYTWFMSLCVDDRLVCWSICSCTPDGLGFNVCL